MTCISSLRNDFPILNSEIDGQPLVYLDSGATTQKPQAVIDSITHFYTHQNANVHRGLHTLSTKNTNIFEQTRVELAQLLNVSEKEIVWTSGTTDSINIIANGLYSTITSQDCIAISALEHHANIVPWQQLSLKTGAELVILPITSSGKLDLDRSYELLLEKKPKVVAISHASNALGNIQPIESIIKICKQIDAISVVDGAQAFLHLRPDLKQLDCDFYVFSAHKALGPTGLGVLYGKYELLNALSPQNFGGEMIKKVSFEQTSFQDAPTKFEAGTPNISAVIGFLSALSYLKSIELSNLQAYEQSLFSYLLSQIKKIEGIQLYGDLENNIGTLSFNYKDSHHFDLSTLLNTYGIALRSGHHCTQPLMNELGVKGTLRVSLAFYNNHSDIDTFISALKESIELLDE